MILPSLGPARLYLQINQQVLERPFCGEAWRGQGGAPLESAAGGWREQGWAAGKEGTFVHQELPGNRQEARLLTSK